MDIDVDVLRRVIARLEANCCVMNSMLALLETSQPGKKVYDGGNYMKWDMDQTDMYYKVECEILEVKTIVKQLRGLLDE